MVFTLPLVLALIGSGVGLLLGILIFGEISDAIVCPPISEFLAGLISFANAQVETNNIVVYHSFDLDEQDQSTTGNNLYVNAGTFGHLADAHMLDTRFHSSIPSQDGIINEAISILSLASNPSMILGNWINEGNGGNILGVDLWEFLVDDSTTNKYTINFWIKGDFSSINAGEGVSVITNTIPITGNSFGIDIWIDDSNQVRIQTFDSGSLNLDLTSSPIADNTWNMVTFEIDKSLNDFINAKIWINATNQEVLSSGSYDTYPIAFLDQPFIIGDTNSFAHKTQFSGVLENFAMDDLCIVKDYEFTQTDVDVLYNEGIGLPCAEVTGLGISNTEIPALSLFDSNNSGDSVEITISDFSENVLFGHIITNGTFTNEEVSRVKLFISDSSNLIDGTLKAVILSNVTVGTTLSGQEVIEAESDVLDFATQNQGTGWYVVFNFTGAVIDWSDGDIFVGFNATDVGTPFDPERLAIGNYGHEIITDYGTAICVKLFNATSVYDECTTNFIAEFQTLIYEWNFVGEGINNKEISTLNFGGGGGGGDPETGNEKCELARDIAWSVIGIMPVALFFGLFTLFNFTIGKPT